MNENKNAPLPCAVVRDLLPLYHDGVVSAETGAAVGEHLTACASCRAEYEVMKEVLPKAPGKDKTTLGRFRAMMKRQKRKKIAAIILAAVLAAAAAAGAIAALSQWYIVPVSAVEVRDVCLIDTPEGERAFVRWTYTYGGSSATKSRISGDGHTVNIEMKHPVLEWVSVKGHERSDFWFVPVEDKIDAVTFNGETVWTAEDETRKSPGYVRAFWDWEQALHDLEGGGSAGYDFADDYVYLLYPDGHEEYWTYDGELLDKAPASSGQEMDWSLEVPPPEVPPPVEE